MGWASAVKERPAKAKPAPHFFETATFPCEVIDWDRLVTLDFETYWDADYTLAKLSTSEYVRDPRFKAQMVGIKVGNRQTKTFPAARVAAELRKIPWSTHCLLAHNAQFDGLILSHHFKIFPKKIYCTLSMARGLHSNDIGAGLDEVSKFYGGAGKIAGGLEPTKGVLDWPAALVKSAGLYCANDVDECLRVFKCMWAKMPAREMDVIDLTVRMFTAPTLKVDLPRVEKELAREIAARDDTMLAVLKLTTPDPKLLHGAEKLLEGRDRDLLMVRRIVGSNERFAALLRAQGVEPPKKLSPAWMKKPAAQRELFAEDQWIYAFAKDDLAFISLPDHPEEWAPHLDREKPNDVLEMAVRSARIRGLVDCRLAAKSTTNITRAERFLVAGARGMSLPCGYAYYRAHTGRVGGNDKMNLTNLIRGGELRASIQAPPGHQVVVADSGQIEARVNAWLWGQNDLLDDFRAADAGTDRDAYCKFGDVIFGRTITKADILERFVSKTATLGLGFQMGAPRFQLTLAAGVNGPAVFFPLQQCEKIVYAYRRKNSQIERGWGICKRIIEDMAAGRTGSWKCLMWGHETIWLPNGMCLKYPDLREAASEQGWPEWTYQAGAHRKKIYGGLLCENIVQALARIIVAVEQMLTIAAKYHVVMQTYDEIVACVKTSQAARALAFMLAAMRTAPPWCADLPLNAEGGFAPNYSK